MRLKYITRKNVEYASFGIGMGLFLYGMTGVPQALKDYRTTKEGVISAKNLESEIEKDTKKVNRAMICLIVGGAIITSYTSNLKIKEE